MNGANGDGPADELPSDTALAPGTKIGRFTLDRLLGAGNVGLVFTAHDPELDRAVAIKILGGADSDEQQATRMIQEARAMAQVRDRHVVTVYDVGRDGDIIFIAMELIRGATLRAHLDASTRSVHLILGWLVQAGRGLRAVHAAGMLHRDFKPDNIFIDAVEDRVVVGDFGLAANVGRRAESSNDSDAAEPPKRDSIPRIEATRRAGTPAYMAPEQLRNEPFDRRADIFAFGVTAWELLTGTRPFAATSIPALQAAIATGARWPSDAPSVPTAVIRILERCIADDPAQRPASIDQVVAVLAQAHTPRRVRRGVVWTTTAITIIAVAATLFVALSARREKHALIQARQCDATAPAKWLAMRDAWNEKARAMLSPYVRDNINAVMDVRATQWPGQAVLACRGDVVAQQAWRTCRPRIERREKELLTLAVSKRWKDDRAWLELIDGIERPSYCGSAQAAQDAVELSSLISDAARETFDQGLNSIALANAYNKLGDKAQMSASLEAGARDAASISPSALDANVALAKASLAPPTSTIELGKMLQDAAAAAERSGQATLIAEAWLATASAATTLVLDELAIDQAMARCDWAITRSGNPPRLRARWDDRAAVLAMTRGDHKKSQTYFAEAAALASGDPFIRDDRRLVASKVAQAGGDLNAAIVISQTMLADPDLMTSIDPVSRASLRMAYAGNLYMVGRDAESRAQEERARDELRGVVADDDPQAIEIDVLRAGVIDGEEDARNSLAILDADIPLIERTLGADHSLRARAATTAAEAYCQLSRWAECKRAADLAAHIFEVRYGKQSAECVYARNTSVQALQHLPGADSDPHHLADLEAEVIEDAKVAFGADDPMYAQLLPVYVELLVKIGEKDKAVPLLEQAIHVTSAAQFDPTVAAAQQFQLAKLLVDTDHKRAHALAITARDVWQAHTDGDSVKQSAVVKKWLAQHHE